MANKLITVSEFKEGALAIIDDKAKDLDRDGKNLIKLFTSIYLGVDLTEEKQDGTK